MSHSEAHLVVIHEGLAQKSEGGEPVVKLLVLDDNSVEVLVKPSSVVHQKTLLHVHWKLAEVLGLVEDSTEHDNGDLISVIVVMENSILSTS